MIPTPRSLLERWWPWTAEGGDESGQMRFLDMAASGWRDDVSKSWSEVLVNCLDQSCTVYADQEWQAPQSCLREWGRNRVGRPAGEDGVLMTPPRIAQPERLMRPKCRCSSRRLKHDGSAALSLGASPAAGVLIGASSRDSRRPVAAGREVTTQEGHCKYA